MKKDALIEAHLELIRAERDYTNTASYQEITRKDGTKVWTDDYATRRREAERRLAKARAALDRARKDEGMFAGAM